MNFFVLLSVVMIVRKHQQTKQKKTLQNYTLYTHRRTFSLSRTYSYKKITKYKQFFLLAIRAQQKIAKFLAQTYLIDIQPSSCSLLNGFSASNQTLQQQIETKQKDRIHQPERRVPERTSRESYVSAHAK